MRSSNTTAEIQSYKGQMDGMAVNLASAEEELLKKDNIISDIKAMLKQHEEEVPVLKEQVCSCRRGILMHRIVGMFIGSFENDPSWA